MTHHKTLVGTILHFSLRIDADDVTGNLVALIEDALGGHFEPQDRHGISLLEMHVLGMAIRFLLWRSIGLKEVFQLVGYTELPDDYEGDRDQIPAIDLNQAIIDLLVAKGAGIWHIPTTEEIHAEASSEVSRIMEGDAAGPPDDWPVDW